MTAVSNQCKSMSEVFGENVRRYSELAGISFTRLQYEAMLDSRQLRDIETGIHNPTLLTMERIADTLGVSLSMLLCEEPVSATTFPLSSLQAEFDQLSPAMQKLLLSIMRDFVRLI